MFDFLEQTFITFFNMSLTGSYIILAIILIRQLLQKAPKIFSYALWSIAGLRLIFPFSFSSVLSIFNLFSMPVQSASSGNVTVNNFVPDDIGMMKIPEISTGIKAADTVINPFLPVPEITDSVNPMQIVTAVASVLWAAGIIAMAVYGFVSLVKVKKRVEFATKLDGNIFECERVRSPFVFGIFKPKIYLPCGMDEKQREFVILHEKNHIRRLDHITRLVSFAVLMLHWYNPLVWVGFNLMVRDMEMSCDEKVLRTLGEDEKKSYGLTLVAIGSNRRFAAAAPLSFGENVVEKRIVNILKFKKPKVIAIVLCVILCIAVGIVCLTNSIDKAYDKEALAENVETFIEEDWQKQVEGNDHYKYEMCVAGAEVVEISGDNKTAYGWQRLYYYNTPYSELLKYEQILSESSSMLAIGFKAELDDKGNIVSLTNYEDDKDIPESVRQKGRFDYEIFERAQEKARKKYEEYIRLVRTYETEYSYVCEDGLYGVEITGCELVTDHFGKPYLVIRAKNDNKDGAYYIDSHFELLNWASGENYEPKRPSPEGETTVPSGTSIGKEVLHFADLSLYIDEIKETSYIARFFVSDNSGEIREIMLELKNIKASSKKPQLVYDTLSYGELIPITEKIKNAVSGTIYPGMNYNNFINLTAEELEEIVKCYNKTKFTKVRNYEMDISKSIYVVIDVPDNKKRHFTISSGSLVEDATGEFYECNSMELYKIVREIMDAHGVVFQPDRPDTTDISVGYTEITTAPQMIKPEIDYLLLSEPYTRPEMSTTSASEREPDSSTGLIVYNIESNIPEELGLKLMGMDVSGRDFLEISFYNSSDRYLYIVPNQVMLREVDGEFKNIRIYNDYEPQTNLVAVAPESFVTVQFPFGYYFDEGESVNGRYSFVTSVDYGTAEGADENNNVMIDFKFSVEEGVYSEAVPDKKIQGNPVMIYAFSQNAQSFVFSMYTYEEMTEIVRLFNSLELEQLPRGDAPTNQLFVRIVDDKGYIYGFDIEPDGIINWEYYAENGAELYKAIQTPAINAAR